MKTSKALIYTSDLSKKEQIQGFIAATMLHDAIGEVIRNDAFSLGLDDSARARFIWGLILKDVWLTHEETDKQLTAEEQN